MATDDYEKQATNFLTETDTKFEAKYIKHGKHFDDDKETRDIYEITLTRGERVYSFMFGQSINDSQYKLKNEHTGQQYTYRWDTTIPLKQVEKEAKKTMGNLQGIEIVEPKAPTAYDVLAGLTCNEVGTFQQFCDDFGYDGDSIKAEKTYKAVLDEWSNVQRIWSESEIEKLQEIQ